MAIQFVEFFLGYVHRSGFELRESTEITAYSCIRFRQLSYRYQHLSGFPFLRQQDSEGMPHMKIRNKPKEMKRSFRISTQNKLAKERQYHFRSSRFNQEDVVKTTAGQCA